MTEESTITLRYVDGTAEIEELEKEITSQLRELTDPGSPAFQKATAAGLDPAPLSRANIEIRHEGKGFGAVAVLIAIYVPVAAHIINKFWDDVIEPRLTGELGADALGHRENSENDNKEDDEDE
jgi:hypothetical protein